MRINILGVGFDNVTMDEALARGEELLCSEGAHYVVTPNPEIVETCRADAAANAAVNGADLVLPDGIGIVYPFHHCLLWLHPLVIHPSRSEAACPASSSARA